MKEGIHPKYREITVTCSCGNSFQTQSTYEKGQQLQVEICSACHPYYTGKLKLIDTEKRVQKFLSRYKQGEDAGKEA